MGTMDGECPNRRVFLSGTAVLSSGRTGISSIWDALGQGKTLPDAEIPADQLLESARLGRAEAAILGRHQLLALAAVEQAWLQAGLPAHRNRLRGEGQRHRLPEIGCLAGSSLGGLDCFARETSDGKEPSPHSLSRWRGNSTEAVVTLRFGLGGSSLSVNAASATGAQLLCLGGNLIRCGMAEALVLVAADTRPEGLLRQAMARNGSMSPNQDDPERGPLSAGRGGMRPREGAGCVILESGAHLRRRGGRGLAEWLAGRAANEAYHLVAPEPGAMALRNLLATTRGDLTRRGGGDRVDWISLHATGTQRFDLVEAEAIRETFCGESPWLTSLKRTTGHCLGAMGLVDAGLIAFGLSEGRLPPWPGNTDPALGLDRMVPPRPPDPRIAIQIGQGMGGTVVVNALGTLRAAVGAMAA